MSHAEIEMQDRDLEAQDSGAAAVGRTFGSEIAWLILRHFVAELPGLSSVKHPFEKCQEVSEVSNRFSYLKNPLVLTFSCNRRPRV